MLDIRQQVAMLCLSTGALLLSHTPTSVHIIQRAQLSIVRPRMVKVRYA